MTELPDYADLPPAPAGGRSGWGLFGAGDNLGLVNLMTPERIAAAARLVRRGQVFCLDMPLGSISPALATFRGTPRHHILHQPGTAGFDDVYDNLYAGHAKNCSRFFDIVPGPGHRRYQTS
jgi:hypothetical protein